MDRVVHTIRSPACPQGTADAGSPWGLKPPEGIPYKTEKGYATGVKFLTPPAFQARTHLAHHALGDMAPVMGRQNPPHQAPVEELWFIGAQSEGGGGAAGMRIGARNVARGIPEEKLGHPR